MEFFGARSGQPLETCLAEVRRSNILVVIVGHRYGTVIPGMGLSFSHAEYEEGYRHGKPCLVYFRADDTPVLPKHVERNAANIKRLERWKESLRARHTIATFRDASDLAVRVAADLGRTLNSIESAKYITNPKSETLLRLLIDGVQVAVENALARGTKTDVVVKTLRDTIAALAPPQISSANVVIMTYAPEDAGLARSIRTASQNANMIVLEDLDQRLLAAAVGDSVFDTIDCIIFLISQAAVASPVLQHSWNIAVAQRISSGASVEFVPVLLETTDIPPAFRDARVLDVRGNTIEDTTSRVLVAIAELISWDRLNL